jgi:hypothetical protein
MRRRLALLCASALLPALLALVLLRVGACSDGRPVAPPPEETAAAAGVNRWLGDLLDPGPLSVSHAELSGVARCLDCHGAASQVIDARCTACHAEIAERARRRVAWHGTFDQPCRACHVEHRGEQPPLVALDRDAFQHKLARFPLQGAHADATCEACHWLVPLEGAWTPVFRYQGVPFAACHSCHSDPHAGGFHGEVRELRQVALDAAAPALPARSEQNPLAGRDCGSCHGEGSFRAAQLEPGSFDHAVDTRFPLRGAHASVGCEVCHTAESRQLEQAEGRPPGRAAKSECADCHEDPHRGALKGRRGALEGRDGCRTCHSEESWTRTFDHARDTRFPLDALHAELTCVACHTDQRYRAAGRECRDCHTDAADLIAGRFGDARGEPDAHADGVACEDCHGTTRAANGPAALARRCADCHTPEYAGLLAAWTAKLGELAASTALEPTLAERLRRSGVHNFPFARDRLAPTSPPP